MHNLKKMKSLINILIFLTSFCCISQTTDFMNFDIDFELDIAKSICYDYKKINNDSVKVNFYLIKNGVTDLQVDVIKLKNNKSEYNLKGVFEYIVGVPIFYPTLVIMVEPIFNNHTKCNKEIKTYFIDLQKVGSDKRVSSNTNFNYGGYIIKLDLEKIKIDTKNYIEVSNENNKVSIKYYDYLTNSLIDSFRYSIGNWYRI